MTQKPSMKATIRAAYQIDIPRITVLYEKLNDPAILPRAYREYSEAVRGGGFFIVEARGTVLGASAVFPVSYDPYYVEFGGTAVDPSARGFDLQRIFLATRICHAVIFYPSELPNCIYTLVDPKNERSAKNVLASGFRTADEIPAPYLTACEKCTKHGAIIAGRKCCYDFFRFDEGAIRGSVKFFLNASPVRTNSSGEVLHLQSSLFPDAVQRKILAGYASGAAALHSAIWP
jgi:N-acetylglutamate synthase-like GNAT family acetyltransferase